MPKESSSSVKVFFPRLSREQVLATLRKRIPVLQKRLPLKRVVLFGSYAQDRQTAGSDIDLLVIYAGEPREDAYAIVRRVLGLHRLEPHVYAESDYAGVRTTVERMARDGVTVNTN